MDMNIRAAQDSDAAALARIYNYYVMHTCATFEMEAVEPADMKNRLAASRSHGLPWLVGDAGGTVLGYAYAAPWKRRAAYRHSVESTVYLDPDSTARGIGARLYARLIDELRTCRVHAVIAGISLPNEPSVRLHERLGFHSIGCFREVGRKQARWVDVGYWELLL
jgi:L-amino acid N-acyltransferase YncA